MTYYATTNNEGQYITEGAHIARFETEAEAIAYVMDAASSLTEDHTIDIAHGSYGDCWVKLPHNPRVGDTAISPFSRNQLVVQGPGQHPGGRAYWVTPRANVIIAVATPK